MDDPISRLEVVTREIDRVFGGGHAAAHPELVIAVMNAASSDWAACANTVGPSCYRSPLHNSLAHRNSHLGG